MRMKEQRQTQPVALLGSADGVFIPWVCPERGNGVFWWLFRVQILVGEGKLLLSQPITQPSRPYQGIKLNGFLKREYI